MSSIATLNGVQYIVPAYNDTGWAQGAGNLSLYLAAIAANTLQPTGGSFTLTADVDFGANFGIKALFLKTETANPASAGVIRLAKTDTIKWRNNANGADLSLTIDGTDNLTYAATKVLLSGAVVNADINAAAAIAYSKLTLTNSIVNADINSAAAIAYSKLSLSVSIVNADIAVAAAIALTKLASTSNYYWYAANGSGVLTPLAVTASRAVATDANGLPVASAVTATELGYVSGVTSAIQTQLNASVANPLTSNLAAGTHKITGMGNGTAATDAAAFGQIFAGFQAPVQAVSTTPFTTTSTSFQTTNLSATITPTSASHRIKITVTGTLSCSNGSTTNAFATIARGTTDLSTSGNGLAQLDVNSASLVFAPCHMTRIDSPASTSPVTYNVRIKGDATATVGFGKGSGADPDQTIILEEIV